MDNYLVFGQEIHVKDSCDKRYSLAYGAHMGTTFFVEGMKKNNVCIGQKWLKGR